MFSCCSTGEELNVSKLSCNYLWKLIEPALSYLERKINLIC